MKMALEVQYMIEYSIQFDDLGYCFQGHLRPAKMTQNGTLDCEAINLLIIGCCCSNRKNIIASLLKLEYIHNYKILPGNIFGLIFGSQGR